jgi:hypothetical protein
MIRGENGQRATPSPSELSFGVFVDEYRAWQVVLAPRRVIEMMTAGDALTNH